MSVENPSGMAQTARNIAAKVTDSVRSKRMRPLSGRPPIGDGVKGQDFDIAGVDPTGAERGCSGCI